MREFFLSPKQPLCACASSSMGSEKSEVAFVRTREQTIASSVVMQPMYSEPVMFVANYCGNTRNNCATNVYTRNMCRGVFKISVHLPLLNLLPDLKKFLLTITFYSAWQSKRRTTHLKEFKKRINSLIKQIQRRYAKIKRPVYNFCSTRVC